MTTTLDNVLCSDCGAEISVVKDTDSYRTPCASCGGGKRTFNASMSDTLVARDFLGMKAKRPSKKRPYVEDISRPSYSHDRKKLVHRHTLIDRDNDKYSEKITDLETGEVIHQDQGPLSAHTGHGSAKVKKTPVDK